MQSPSGQADQIPKRIRDRLQELDREIDGLVANAQSRLATPIARRFQFRMTGTSTDGELMPLCKRAQSLSFVTRYENLPDEVEIHLVQQNGRWTMADIWVLRHVLNDFRPIVQNQRDEVYYVKVHNYWNRMLQRTDRAEGIVVRVIDDANQDVTRGYSDWLTGNKRAITVVLQGLEFGYLFNGILQHSDAHFSERFFSDYVSGELNYLLWKHVRVLGFIKSLLKPYYEMMTVLTSPKAGSL
jgi:hypothetical protein